MKKIVQGAAGQLGKLALDTTIEAAKEPLALEKLTGSSSNSQGQSQTSGKPGAKKNDFAQMMKKDQAESGAEIAGLRAQLSRGEGGAVRGPVRNVEKEIKEVRMRKEKLLEEKERELLVQIEQKRKEEEALAEQDAMPVSSRPKRGSALSPKKNKGTTEVDMRRSV